MFTSFRFPIVALGLLLGSIAAPGCSSKPAEIDTAETVPDPAVKPAPAPTPTPTPTPTAAPVVSSDAAPTAAPPTTTTTNPEAKP